MRVHKTSYSLDSPGKSKSRAPFSVSRLVRRFKETSNAPLTLIQMKYLSP